MAYSWNFGQQPFAYATDNGNGTVMLVDTSPNKSEKWSDNVTNTGSYASGSTPDKMFNGNLANGQDNKCEATAPGIITFTSPVQQTGNLRVRLSSGANPSSPNGESGGAYDL